MFILNVFFLEISVPQYFTARLWNNGLRECIGSGLTNLFWRADTQIESWHSIKRVIYEPLPVFSFFSPSTISEAALTKSFFDTETFSVLLLKKGKPLTKWSTTARCLQNTGNGRTHQAHSSCWLMYCMPGYNKEGSMITHCRSAH